MFRRLNNRKAQSIAEYALLFAVVLGAYIGLQTAIKQSLQSRVRDALDFSRQVATKGNALGDTGTGAILSVNGNDFAFTDRNTKADQDSSTATKRTSKEEKGALDGGTELVGKDSVSQTWKVEGLGGE